MKTPETEVYRGLPPPTFCDKLRDMQASRLHRPRRSTCADASLRAELERVGSMTVEERVKAALSIGKRFSWVKKISKQS